MNSVITIKQAIENGLQIGQIVKFPDGKIRYYRGSDIVHFGKNSRLMHRFTTQPNNTGASYDGNTLIEVI